MKVHLLPASVVGMRIRCTRIEGGPAEERGLVKDRDLVGQEGVATAIRKSPNADSPSWAQLSVEWDNGSRLMLVGEDEVEVIE